MRKVLEGCDVLLVEDEPLVMLDIMCALEDVGARVHCARKVPDALKVVGSAKISAAIVDYVLAEGTADELCAELQARAIPFAIYSGFQIVAGPCGGTNVLSKPRCADDLVAKVVSFFVQDGVQVPCATPGHGI